MGMKQMLSKMVADAGAHTPLLRKRDNRVAPVLSNRWEQEIGVGQSWVPLSYGEYYPRSIEGDTTDACGMGMAKLT